MNTFYLIEKLFREELTAPLPLGENSVHYL